MMVSMYLSIWAADPAASYRADCKVDDDGDVQFKFAESDSCRDEVMVTLNPRQFKVFMDKLDDLRNSIELAEAAEEYAENHPDGEKINRQQEVAEILDGIGDTDDVAF